MAESAPAAAPEPNPWDQRPDESPEAYARFLSYRNLGPGRSVALAECAHSGGKRRQKASGSWSDDSAKYDWVSRAAAWDVEQLKAQGPELGRLFFAAVLETVRKATQKLMDPACKPRDFKEAVAAIKDVAPWLTADVIKALQPAPAASRTGPDAVRETALRGAAVAPEPGAAEPGVPE